jgi:hypothetical protein
MIGIDPGQKSGLNDNTAAKDFVNLVVDSPLTRSAWISQSTRKTIKAWFVLCIFTTENEARIAADGLQDAIDLGNLGEVSISCSLFLSKASWNVAKMIDPAKATAPRGPQAASPPKQKIVAEVPKAPSISNVTAPIEDDKQKTQFAQNKLAFKIHTAKAGVTISQNPLQEVAIEQAQVTNPTTSIQHLLKPPQNSATTTQASSSQNKENFAINAVNLQQMEWSELAKYQCRYLGGSEEGVANYGCILCGQRSHTWGECPGRACGHCGEMDNHVSQACPKVKKCFKCMEKGHKTDECTSKLKRTAEDGFHCDRCGEETHYEDDCWYIFRQLIPENEPNLKKVPALAVFCYNCGKQGLHSCIVHWIVANGDRTLGCRLQQPAGEASLALRHLLREGSKQVHRPIGANNQSLE